MITSNEKLDNTARVYVATFDDGAQVGEVAPALRNEFVKRCNDPLTKQQSYCVWKLLDYALKDCCGVGVDKLDFAVSESGKWSCNSGVYFSLTHCNNVVAVAIGSSAVGVDIEAVANFARHADDACFCERVLTDGELRSLRDDSTQREETLAKIWTQKESIFKMGNDCAFSPKAIDTTQHLVHSQILTIDGASYALSVASNAQKTRIKRVEKYLD